MQIMSENHSLWPIFCFRVLWAIEGYEPGDEPPDRDLHKKALNGLLDGESIEASLDYLEGLDFDPVAVVVKNKITMHDAYPSLPHVSFDGEPLIEF
jgi:hypothetical protein